MSAGTPLNTVLKQKRVNVDVALVTCPKAKGSELSTTALAQLPPLEGEPENQKPCVCCRNVLTSETLSLGCVDDRRRVLNAVGVACAFSVFSPLLKFYVSPRDTHTALGFSSRTLLSADRLNANLIKVNQGSFLNWFLSLACVKFHIVRVDRLLGTVSVLT